MVKEKQSTFDALHEKLNVYLPEDVYEKLLEDCTGFKVVHGKDGKPNINKLCNMMIDHFLDDYLSSLNRLSDDIFSQIKPFIAQQDDDRVKRVAKQIAFNNSVKSLVSTDRNLKTLSLKINERSISTISEAIAKQMDSVELSTFFRGLILSFLALPTYKRERIIYADRYATVMAAIDRHESIDYRNLESGRTPTFYPRHIDTSKHELFNYVIGEYVGKDHHTGSVRLATLNNVFLSNKHSEFAPEFEEHYQRMKKHGVQFAIGNSDIHSITLTPEGYQDFKKNYLERPIPLEKDPQPDKNGNYTLTFDCSEMQFNKYFFPYKGKMIEKK